MRKKRLLIPLLAVLMVIAGYWLARSGQEMWLEKTTSPWTSIEMGTGKLQIRYSSGWAFSPHDVYFYFHEKSGARLLGRTELHNDGATPDGHNLQVNHQGGGNWLITLKGQEQKDEHWQVETAGGKVRIHRVGTR